MTPRHFIQSLLSMCVVLSASQTYARETQAISGYKSFRRGEFDGVHLTGEGRLKKGLDVEKISDVFPGPVISLANVSKKMFAITAAPAALFEVKAQRDQKAAELYRDEENVFVDMQAVDSDRVVMLSTEPALYVFDTKRKTLEHHINLDMKLDGAYRLFMAKDLWVAGEFEGAGRILRVNVAKDAEAPISIVGDIDEEIAGCLWVKGDESQVIVGGLQQGRVFSWTGQGFETIYESHLDEITDIDVDVSGRIYIASVDASKAFSEARQKVLIPESKKKKKRNRSVSASELIRLNPDRTIEKLWQAKNHGIFDILLTRLHVYLATGGGGYIYRLDKSGSRAADLVAQTDRYDEVTSLLWRDETLYATTVGGSSVYRLGDDKKRGYWESPVFMLRGVSKLGYVRWQDFGAGDTRIQMRVGYTYEPDANWSSYSEYIDEAGVIDMPVAPYAQIRVALKGEKELEWVRIAYQPINRKPDITQVVVLPPNWRIQKTHKDPDLSDSMTIGDNTFSRQSGSGEQKMSAKKFYAPGYQTIAVNTEDPDGDKLRFRFQIGRVDKNGAVGTWRLGKDWSKEPFWSFPYAAFPEGDYRFLVEVDDAFSQGLTNHLSAKELSTVIQIRHQAPHVDEIRAVRHVNGVRVMLTAAGSVPLGAAFCHSLSGDSYPLNAKDGVIDQPVEQFDDIIPISKVDRLVCEIYDEQGRSITVETDISN